MIVPVAGQVIIRGLMYKHSTISDCVVITLFQQLCCAFPMFPLLVSYITKKKIAKAPIILYITLGFLHGISIYCSNFASFIMGDAGESLFCSISIIFVLLSNQIFLKQRTTPFTATASCIITFILVITSVFCISKDVHVDIKCLFALFTTVLLDSFTITMSELIFNTYGTENNEFEIFVFPISAVVSLLAFSVFGRDFSIIISALNNTKLILCVSFYGIAWSISMYCLCYSVKNIGSLLTISSWLIGKTTVNALSLPKLKPVAIVSDTALFALFGVQLYFTLFHKPKIEETSSDYENSDIVFKTVYDFN